MTTGERIRHKRIEAGLTKTELAALLEDSGKSRGGYISGIESDRLDISFQKLRDISEILHTNVFYLAGITINDQMTNNEAIAIVSAALDAAKVEEPAPQASEMDLKCVRVLNAISSVRIARG